MSYSKFVLSIIEEFQCRDKIFIIGFDNASNYNAAMRLLTNTLEPIMNGIFFSLKMCMSYSKINCQSGYGSRPSLGIDRQVQGCSKVCRFEHSKNISFCRVVQEYGR
jgi:hypothetical protein